MLTFRINLQQDPHKDGNTWEWEVRNPKTDELILFGDSWGKDSAKVAAERAARRTAQAESYLYVIAPDGNGTRVEPPTA